MSSQRRVAGDASADLCRQKGIDVETGKLQLQIGRHVATQFNPSIHRQTCRREIRSRRELEMTAMGHRVGCNAAETVPVEHQVTHLRVSVDQRLLQGACSLGGKPADTSYLHVSYVQFGDIRQIDALARQVEARILITEV